MKRFRKALQILAILTLALVGPAQVGLAQSGSTPVYLPVVMHDSLPATPAPPDPPGNAAAVTLGGGHACVVTTAGGVKCWGYNYNGQLGDGTTTNRSTPVDVVGLSSGVTSIVAGSVHTCALTTAGGVKCWGHNDFGQLGDGTAIDRLTPADVVGLSSGVASITAGSDHNCAVTTAGGLKCWGYNGDNELGDGTKIHHNTPVDVVGLSSGVISVAGGQMHTCALTTAGGVKCWGNNYMGELGDGTTYTQSTPVDVVGLSSGVASITARSDHTCAVTAAGGVKCWGYNYNGELGDGTTTNRLTPVDVVGLSSGTGSITAGSGHTCAVTAAGGVKCWGYNSEGQLGNGETAIRPAPVEVVGLSSGIRQISAGSGHTCALTAAGGVKCWGRNADGQLGDGTTTDRYTPVDVVGLSSGVLSIAAGPYHTCALTDAGGMKCWGNNLFGQLGDGTPTRRLTPVDVIRLFSGVRSIAVGAFQTCALTDAGGVKCWGDILNGYLENWTPVDVVGLSSGVTSIAAGSGYSCALTTAGGVKCWGYNGEGRLGDGTETDQYTPVDVVGLSTGVASIAAGGGYSCALTATGGVKCWGYNEEGQLGDGTTTTRLTPVDVAGLSCGVASVAGGGLHTCALTAAGGVKCWGYNGEGRLGDGTTTNQLTPVDVVGLSSGVTSITVGFGYTCALTTAGGVKCWGYDGGGQLGDGGAAVIRTTPVSVVGFP